MIKSKGSCCVNSLIISTSSSCNSNMPVVDLSQITRVLYLVFFLLFMYNSIHVVKEI